MNLPTHAKGGGHQARHEAAAPGNTHLAAAPGNAHLAAALLNPQLPCPPQLRACNGSDPTRRLAVYRNNVLSSLVDALASTFPVLQQLVGQPFFRAMAAAFVRQHPPRSPVLSAYGEALPRFLAAFEPAQALPYLASVATLEATRVAAYHAADATVLPHAELAQAMALGEALAQVRLVLNPSVHALALPHAAVALWAAHQLEGEGEAGAQALADALARVDPFQAECALVLRQHHEVLVLPVDAPTAAFVQQLQAGQALGVAAEQAMAAQADSPFDLGRALALLLAHDALQAWHLP